jgi:hypothetical protein
MEKSSVIGPYGVNILFYCLDDFALSYPFDLKTWVQFLIKFSSEQKLINWSHVLVP